MNQKESLKVVELYTDGACSGNPGPGGWAFILRCPRTGKELERSDGMGETTNNVMELTAVLKGLEALKEPCHVKLFADSVYVGKGMSEWMPGWKKEGVEAKPRRQTGGAEKSRSVDQAWTNCCKSTGSSLCM